MLKTIEMINILQHLVEKGEEAEKHFREAASCMKRGSEKALFIYFWQEHAKIVTELQAKIRSSGGQLRNSQLIPWGGLNFRISPVDSKAFEALAACDRSDWDLLQDYEHALKLPLPFDMLALFKLHVVKIRGFLARLTEFSGYLHRQVHMAQLETVHHLATHSA